MKVRYALAGAALVGLALLLGSIWDHDAALDWLAQARPLPFFVALAILPAIGAPLSPFFLLAGVSFGILLGLIGSGVALALNLALCYWIAHGSVRDRLRSLLRRRFNYELPDF